MEIKPGIVTMPGLGRLNEVLGREGLGARLVVVNRSAGLTFGRRMLPDLFADQVAEWQQQTRASCAAVVEALGMKVPDEGLLPITAVGYSSDPDAIPKQKLVRLTRGPGFLDDDNPHEPCLALVSTSALSEAVALAVPFADAPPVYMVYTGRRFNGSTFVVTALLSRYTTEPSELFPAMSYWQTYGSRWRKEPSTLRSVIPIS